MGEPLTINEEIFGRCWFCGKQVNLPMYTYYCSKGCEQADFERFMGIIDSGKHPVEAMRRPIELLSEKGGGD